MWESAESGLGISNFLTQVLNLETWLSFSPKFVVRFLRIWKFHNFRVKPWPSSTWRWCHVAWRERNGGRETSTICRSAASPFFPRRLLHNLQWNVFPLSTTSHIPRCIYDISSSSFPSYQAVGQPLLSMKTSGSMDVKRAAKPFKHLILKKDRFTSSCWGAMKTLHISTMLAS